MVDAADLKSASREGSVGSSPSLGMNDVLLEYDNCTFHIYLCVCAM